MAKRVANEHKGEAELSFEDADGERATYIIKLDFRTEYMVRTELKTTVQKILTSLSDEEPDAMSNFVKLFTWSVFPTHPEMTDEASLLVIDDAGFEAVVEAMTKAYAHGRVIPGVKDAAPKEADQAGAGPLDPKPNGIEAA